MNVKNEMLEQLQRYYILWKESNVIYEEWAKSQGLSINSLLILYSFFGDSGNFTQKAISQKWHIPKQTVNTILKDFEKRGYVKLISMPTDKRNKQIQLTPMGKQFSVDIITKLQKIELYVIEKMGLAQITNMNDELDHFVRLFREEGLKKDE